MEIGAQLVADHFASVCLGLGLAAAAGFRIFVPLLVLSFASYTGHLELSSGFEWIGTLPALVALFSATLLEVGAYYVPWLDNLLDAVAAPAAVVAGSVVAASAFTEIDPFWKWSLAIIGGGGLAGVVKGTTTLARGLSTATTGGIANPLLSTFEAGASLSIAFFAIVVPLLTLAVVVVVTVVVARRVFGWLGHRQAA